MSFRDEHPGWAIPKAYDGIRRSIGRKSDGTWFVHEESYTDDWFDDTPFDIFEEARDYLNTMTNRK